MHTKIVAISDTHNFHSQLTLPSGDILVHAGDAGTEGTQEELENFLEWFSKQPYAHKVYVPGNHDNPMENPDYEYLNKLGIELLWDREISVRGIRIYGSPYRVVPDERVLQKRSRERHSAFKVIDVWADLIWREIPEGIDILVTHMPPYGILDLNKGIHWGSSALLKHVERTKPKYHIFGHIHDVNDIVKGQTTFANVSICDEYGQPTHPVTCIDY